MEIQLLQRPEPTINSLEISEMVNVRHDKVRQSIERLAIRGTITLPPLGVVSNEGSGPKSIAVYHIGKRDSYIIVAQLSPEFTAKLVDRWQELEATAQLPAFKIPETMSDALRLAADSIDRAEKAELALADAAPKLVTYNTVMATDNLFGFRDAAAMLAVPGLGGNNLVVKLLKDGVLYRDDKGKLRAYRSQIEKGRFKAVEQPYQVPGRDEHKVSMAIKITQAGIDWLANKYGKGAA